jgi:hypothetical protein
MNRVIEIGSGAMMYIPSFLNIGSGIQELLGRIYYRHADTQTHRQQGDLISTILFFQNK